MVLVVDLEVDFDGDGDVNLAPTFDAQESATGAVSGRYLGQAELITDARYSRGIQLLEGVVAMLTKML